MYFIVCEYAEDNIFLMFNNINKQVIALNQKEHNVLNKFLETQVINKDDKFLEFLISNWYIVPEDFDEVKVFDQLKEIYNSIKLSQETGNFSSFTILPTTTCNARCFYCYEAGCQKITATNQQAKDIANFIIKNVSKKKKCKLSWFGGEPLCGKDKIDLICKELQNAGIKYNSSMISNGYIFDKDIVQKAKNFWNLNHIQITLDGTRDVYNSSKNYSIVDNNDERSPFDRVIDNIELLIKAGIRVIIRINLSYENEGDIENLIDYIDKRFAGIKKYKDKNGHLLLNIYPHTLFQDLKQEDSEHSKLNQNLDSLYEREIKIYNKIEDCGYSILANLPSDIRINHCMADSSTSVVILPDGKLTSCEHINEILEPWGTIYSSKYNHEILSKWKEFYSIQEECIQCPNYPSCIRLKQCPQSLEYCDPVSQKWQIKLLHKRLNAVYKQWKNNKQGSKT